MDAVETLEDVGDEEVPDVILGEAVAIVADMNLLATAALAQNKTTAKTGTE